MDKSIEQIYALTIFDQEDKNCNTIYKIEQAIHDVKQQLELQKQKIDNAFPEVGPKTDHYMINWNKFGFLDKEYIPLIQKMAGQDE